MLSITFWVGVNTRGMISERVKKRMKLQIELDNDTA
jgi:hypothetical protein